MIDIVAIVAVGVGTIGILLIVFKLWGQKAPRYLIPMSAGAAMVIFTVYNDYDWVNRAKKILPPDVVVAKEIGTEILLRPWTMFVPVVEQLVIFDKLKLRRHATQSNFVMVEAALMSRYMGAQEKLYLVDCDAGKEIELTAESKMGDDGLPTNGEWLALTQDAPMLVEACKAPAN